MKYDVFISYSRKDSKIANQICAALDSVGISYFIDRQGISGGLEFPDVLADAICNCKIFLFLASENSYNSKFTKSEIIFAFNKKDSCSLLPYIIDDSELPPALALTFASINWRTIKNHPIDTVLMNDLCYLLGRSGETSDSKSSGNDDSTVNNTTSDQAAIDYDNLTEAELNNLALKYYIGDGVKQNLELAFKLWYKAATVKGDSTAMYYIGFMYDEGQGVSQSYSKAFRWYKAAAEKGVPQAMNSLGFMYFTGRGVSKDYNEALRWYRAADEKGASTVIRTLSSVGHVLTQNMIQPLLKKVIPMLCIILFL